MITPYVMFANLGELDETPTDGTLSRTLHNDEQAKEVLFNFSAGQELSEHTASMPAVLHFLSGDRKVELGDDLVAATTGAWIHMPANLPHRIRTKTPVTCC